MRIRSKSLTKVVATLGVATLAAFMTPLPGAQAVGETLAITLSAVDGTPAWDADDLAGHDSGPSNQIVRTNDNIAYSVELSSNGGTAENGTITIVLPRGVQFDALPAYCVGPGSELSPAVMPEPTIPVTATSWQSLPIQTLVCNVGDVVPGSTFARDFVARVRPEVPNGTVLPKLSVSATSSAVPTPVLSNEVPDMKVSARAQYDLTKNGVSTGENNGPVFAVPNTCSSGTGQCYFVTYPVLIAAPVGGKGSSPLAGSVTFTENLTPASLYGPSVTSDPEWLAASDPLSKYGARAVMCSASDYGYTVPRRKIGADATSTAVNSVRDNGSVNCEQPGGPGTPATYTITGMDSTAYTYPSQAHSPVGFALPVDRSYVFSGTVRLEIPYDAIRDLGVTVGTSTTLRLHNVIENLTATDIGGLANTGDRAFNNYRDSDVTLTNAGAVNKFFAGVPGAVGNTPGALFTPSSGPWEGPAGSTGPESGIGQLFPGGQTTSSVVLYNSSTSGADRTFLACDSWDNSKLNLTNMNSPAGAFNPQRYAPAGRNVWMSGFNTYTEAQATALIKNLKIQYGTGVGAAGEASLCTDQSSPDGWFDDAADVPGNDPAMAAEGVYTGVSRVRWSVTVPSTPALGYTTWAIGLRAADGLATGTILPNWATVRQAAGAFTLDEMLQSSEVWTPSTYDPATNRGNLGDRLIVASAVGRLVKEVWDPSRSAFVTTVPTYVGGQTAQFRLRPSLTSGLVSDVTRNVVVEDCIIPSQIFKSASVTPTTAEVITGPMPDGAQITCQPGEMYLKWDLGKQTLNATIPPITYDVSTAYTVDPGTYTNRALVTAEDDLSPLTERDAQAQIQVVQPRGVFIDKVALTPVHDVNLPTETNPDVQKWRIDMVNLQSAAPMPSDIDIIDVLPRNGVNGTDFNGSLVFVSAVATVNSDPGQPVQVLFTKDPAVSVTDRTAYAASQSLAWCAAADDSAATPVLGAGSCPASLSEVTGLRFLRAGEFGPSDKVSIELTMLGMNNANGDVYVNQTAATAKGLELLVGPVLAPERIVGGSIGNLVWNDTNGNGIQDGDELGQPGFKVILTGTDSDGNPVSLSTTTDLFGKYTFANLPAGTYAVTFDPASLGTGQFFTTQNLGGDDSLDSDGDPSTGKVEPITLASGQVIDTIDQGLTKPQITIVKQVCITGSGCDLADDAQWTESTQVFSGQPVDWRIKVTNPGAIDLGNVKVSDPLAATCDKVIGVLPAGASESWMCSTASLTAPITPNVASVTATDPRGGELTASDTASAKPYSGSIGDTVWYDVNGDGLQNAGEPGIANATVTVVWTDPATGATKTFTTTTDANGQYLVTGLPAGNYTVTVTDVDPDLKATYDLDGKGTASTASLTLADGQSRTDVDFGYTALFNLGNTVWIDTNGNGVLDAGEPKVADGTVVQLWNATTNTYVAQTTTTGGVYAFTGLPAGDYYVVIPASQLTGPLAGAVAAPNGGTDPDNNADETADHNAVAGSAGAIQSGTITLSATLSGTAGNQLTGNEPTAEFTNNTLDLALLGAPAIKLTKEVCDPAAGACDLNAPVATGGWVETLNATFLDTVTWRIIVSNTGRQDLTNVTINDPLVAGCAMTIPGTFAVGATNAYTCQTTGLLVGFTNTADVTGTGPTGTQVTSSDPARVTTPDPVPGIKIIKQVVSAGVSSDANTAPGVNAVAGSTASFTYTVTLPAGVNVPMKNVTVTDDNGTPANTADDWAATYVSGDTNGNSLLDVGETWLFNSGTHNLTVPTGQYTNVATVLGTPAAPGNTTPLAAQDPANIFGVAAGIEVVKFTNEIDANEVSGPGIVVGDTVTWRYLVKNTGNVPLINVTVVDDKGVAVRCGAADADNNGSIDFVGVGQAHWVSCYGTGIATAGQYGNVATATGTPADVNGVPLQDPAGNPLPKPTDTDPSHYFGVAPSIGLVKTTQTINSDAPTGPAVKVGDPVKWTYTVTNTGTTALVNVAVTDDKVAATAIDCGAGSNTVAFLLPGASATCTASGVATVGQYANTGSVTGDPVLPPTGSNLGDPTSWPSDPSLYAPVKKADGSLVPSVGATNPDHYLGVAAGVDLTKYVNGVDANEAYGPFVTPGSAVTWTYKVVNTGTTALSGVTVTDDKIADSSTISCGTTANVIALLLPGEAHAVTCTVSGVAPAGEYVNVGTASGLPVLPIPAPGVVMTDPSTWPTGAAAYEPLATADVDGEYTVMGYVSDTDPAHLYGVTNGVSLVKKTNGEDANEVTGPFIPAAGHVMWTYEVKNTGTSALVNVAVTDDKVAASDITCDGDNVIDLLLPGQTVTCEAHGVAVAGQYANMGAASGSPVIPKAGTPGVDLTDPTTWPKDPTAYVPVTSPDGQPVAPVTAEDPSHYFGAAPSIKVVKEVCSLASGCEVAAAKGWVEVATLASGSSAQFRITVVNTGNVALKPVSVTDPIAPACDKAIDMLAVGESVSYGCSLANVTTEVVNVAHAEGAPVDKSGKSIIDPTTGQPVQPVTASDDARVKIAGSLAQTGADITGVVIGSGLLMLVGLILVFMARVRRQER